MTLPPAAEAILKAGLYLRNWRAWTVQTYRHGLAGLYSTLPYSSLHTKDSLTAWVLALRAQGLTPGGCNIRIRTINSFLSWLHDEGMIPERLKVKLLRAPQRQLTLLSPADVRALLLYKPRTDTERRTWTLILLLLDTDFGLMKPLGSNERE